MGLTKPGAKARRRIALESGLTQDQLEILRLHGELKSIASYRTPAQLRRVCQKEYGLEYEEALEYAYDNVLWAALGAIHGMRLPKAKKKPEAA